MGNYCLPNLIEAPDVGIGHSPALQRWDERSNDVQVPSGTAECFFRPAGLVRFFYYIPSVKTLGYYRSKIILNALRSQTRTAKISCLQSREHIVNEARAVRQRLVM
jgi:hypothetical protein